MAQQNEEGEQMAPTAPVSQATAHHDTMTQQEQRHTANPIIRRKRLVYLAITVTIVLAIVVCAVDVTVSGRNRTRTPMEVACHFIGVPDLKECHTTTNVQQFLVGSIPSEIGLLTQLTWLSLYDDTYNQQSVVGTIPSSI